MINPSLCFWDSVVAGTTVTLDSLSEVAGVWAGTFSAVDVSDFSVEVYDTLNSVVLGYADSIPFNADMSLPANWINFASGSGLLATDLASYTVLGSTITNTGTTIFSFDFQGFTANALGALPYTDNIRITITASTSSAIMAMDETLFSLDGNYTTTLNGELLTLPISGTYELQISWGDGAVTRGMAGLNTHIYAIAGSYDVKVLGMCDTFRFNGGGDRLNLNSIAQWGDLGLTTLDGFLRGCANCSSLPVGAITGADGATNARRALNGMTSMTDFDNDIFSLITGMINASEMFVGTAITIFRSGWFASNGSITNMNNICLSVSTLTTIETGALDAQVNLLSIFQGWIANSALLGVPANFFDNCVSLTDLRSCFSFCASVSGSNQEPWLLFPALIAPNYIGVPDGMAYCFGSPGFSNFATTPNYWKT